MTDTDPTSPLTRCPLDPGWRLWTMFHNRYDRVPPEITALVTAAKNAVASADAEALHVNWTIADDDASKTPMTTEESRDVAWRFGDGSPWHIHTDVMVGDDTIHIDVVGATRFGPGSTWKEVRIHINGELRGRGGSCGTSLGGGGSDLPARALVGGRQLVTVAVHQWPKGHNAEGIRVTVRDLK